jgi:hypothetical protein
MSRNLINRKTTVIILLLGLLPILVSWGVFGHEHINRAAVFALPPPLQTFFYNHIDFITQESTVPDLRKYTLNDKTERPRHYVNLEKYGLSDSLTLNFDELQKKYEDPFLMQNGILPWYLKTMMEKLTKAFKEKRKTEILFLAADLGHYIADAHMPLHTTVNHDGELTDQTGIHAFWEAQLPDLFGNSFNFKTQTAIYVDNIDQAILDIIFSSHKLVDTLLLTEQKLKNTFNGKIYDEESPGKIAKNKFGKPIHSFKYAKEYHTLLNGMVEKQMKKAILTTANFWYTSWINAGKPDLKDLDSKELTDQNAKSLEREIKLWNEGKLFGLESEKEF